MEEDVLTPALTGVGDEPVLREGEGGREERDGGEGGRQEREVKEAGGR